MNMLIRNDTYRGTNRPNPIFEFDPINSKKKNYFVCLILITCHQHSDCVSNCHHSIEII